MKHWMNVILVVAVLSAFLPGSSTPNLAGSQAPAPQSAVDLPGWPMPDKPIPHHEPGRPSKAESYTTIKEVASTNGPVGIEEVNGLEAIMADGNDPLASNYRLVGKDQLLRSSDFPGDITLGLETFDISPTIALESGSEAYIGNFAAYDIAAADLNNDGQAEQITAWLDKAPAATSGILKLSTSEMPGTFGRPSSALAAAPGNGYDAELLVRGSDHALWHCFYDAGENACAWEGDGGGGVMLSAPVVVTHAPGEFDVYAILHDNLLYRRTWSAMSWSGSWVLVDDSTYWQPLARLVPVPELPTPAVAAHDGQLEVFRLGPDNTLRWRHSADNGTSWDAWQDLGGSLASGLAAIELDSGGVQVFARGADDALWTRIYDSGAWGGWLRVELAGMPEGVRLASAPAAIVPAAGQIDVYGRGSDDALWAVHFNGSTWGSWSSLGGTLISAVGGLPLGETYLFAQTGEGGLQTYKASAGWAGLLGEIPARPNEVNTGLTGHERKLEDYHNFSVDLETGYFWGDGRSQIVLGYYAGGTAVTLALYDISDSPDARGLTPEWVTSSAPVNGGGLGVGHFRIATGDFLDGDGLDEIAVIYTIGNNPNDFMEEVKYRVDIYRFNRTLRSLDFVDSVSVDGSGSLTYPFAGTLVPAAGDFDGDGHDELAVTTSWVAYVADSYGNCAANLYWFMLDAFDLDKIVPSPGYDLKRYYVDSYHSHEADVDAKRYQVSLTLAAGDVIGDGRVEILRTWPDHFNGQYYSQGESCLWPDYWNYLDQSKELYRKAQAVMLPENTNPDQNSAWSSVNDGNLDGQYIKDIRGSVGPTEWSFNDRLAAGDFDRDLREEVFYQQAKSSADLWLITYQLAAGGGSFVQSHYLDDGWHWNPRLAVADFSGESIRVGLPTYRKQYSVGKVIAIVNAPPKHKDVVGGVEYDLNASQSSTYAVYEQTLGTSTEVSVNTHADWGISSELRGTIGDPEGSHLSGSIEASYGQDFGNDTSSKQETTFAQKVSAVTDDVLYYVRVNYEVWEYPVFDRLTNEPQGYMSVVWPSGINNTMDSANTCEGWYRPSHQLMNVWSYPGKPEEFKDRDTTDVLPAPDGDGIPDRDLYSVPNYEVGVSPTEFSVDFTNIASEKRSFKYSIGVAISIEAQLGGDEVDAQVTKTRTPSLYFSAKGTFNYSDLSEVTTVTTSSTKLSGFFDPISDVIPGHPNGNDYRYYVDTYLYRSKSDALVMNYVTDPTNQWFWSSASQIYNKPDPAFILPWAGGQCDHLWEDAKYYSSDIVVDPPMVKAGEVVTVTATLRNFSNLGNGSLPFNQPFKLYFYQGDPAAGGVKIGEHTFNVSQLEPRGVLTRSINWTANGSGEQHIYAVIDPLHTLAEVHDETDAYVNNNKGYGVVTLDAVEFVDVGQADEQPYFPVTLTQGDTAPVFGLHVPLANFSDNLRFDLLTSDQFPGLKSLGEAFEIQAFRTNWDNPASSFTFTPEGGDAPALVMVDYANASLQGFIESELKLFRFNGINWEPANWTCGLAEGGAPLYDQYRLWSGGRYVLAVPICRPGTFFLGDVPPVIEMTKVFLPMIRR